MKKVYPNIPTPVQDLGNCLRCGHPAVIRIFNHSLCETCFEKEARRPGAEGKGRPREKVNVTITGGRMYCMTCLTDLEICLLDSDSETVGIECPKCKHPFGIVSWWFYCNRPWVKPAY